MPTIGILCIIPISTTGMSTNLRRMYPSTETVEITFMDGSGLDKCPPCIENHEQALQSTKAILPRAAQAISSASFDGVLVCCFSDHPLVYTLQNICDVPVTGIFQAAIEDAMSRVGQYGIVTTAATWEPILTQSVQDLRCDSRCAGVRATGLGVLELETLPRNEVMDAIVTDIELLRKRGATSIILGCAGMATLEESISVLLPDVHLIDGVRSGLAQLIEIRTNPQKAGQVRDQRL